MAGFTAIALTAATVVGTAASVYGTIQSTKASKKAAAARRRQEQLQETRSRRQAIREMQVRRAQAIATAQGAGSLQTSGASGGIGSLSSQLGTGLGFQSQMGSLSDIVSSETQRAQRFGAMANLGGQVAAFGASRGGADFLFGQQSPNRPPGNNVSGFMPSPVRPQARPRSYPNYNMPGY